jgi:hypothetical protein
MASCREFTKNAVVQGSALAPAGEAAPQLYEYAPAPTPSGWYRYCSTIARLFHDSVSRDREDECAPGQPQGREFEAYLNSTSQGALVLPVPSVVAGSLPKGGPRTPGRTVISTVGAAES